MKNLVTAILTLTFFSNTHASDTTITGNIPDGSIWSTLMADTFYIQSGTVLNGDELIINDGVVVVVENQFDVEGYVEINGTSNSRVVFINALIGTPVVVIEEGEVAYTDFIDIPTIRIDNGYSDFDNCYFTGVGAVFRVGGTGMSTYFHECTFEDNDQPLIINREAYVDGCTFINNGQLNNSRALHVQSTQYFEITGCDFEFNHGGALDLTSATFNPFNHPNSLIAYNTFYGNSASTGAAIYATGTTGTRWLDIMENTMDSNVVTGNGGAIFFSGVVKGHVSGNLLTRNRASLNGGAMYFAGQNEIIDGNTFLNNHADSRGGGVYFKPFSQVATSFISNILANNSANRAGGFSHGGASRLRIINCTITNNIDTVETGGISMFPSFNRESYIVNTIIRGNSSINTLNNEFATSSQSRTHFYNCDVEGGIGSAFGANNFDANPLFASATTGPGSHIDARQSDWAVNGCTSPCRNTGVLDSLFAFEILDYDAAGRNRIASGRIDVGALETIGTSAGGAWLTNNICQSDPDVNTTAVFPTNGSAQSTQWQVDTGSGWFPVIPSLIPGISFSGDSLSASGAPLSVVNYNYRVINTFSCFTDTSDVWSPTIINTQFSLDSILMCAGGSYFAGGQMQTTSGTYIDTLIGWQGCDSIHTTYLRIPMPVTTAIFDTICEGDTWTDWPGASYTAAGTYDRTFSYNEQFGSQSLSCDSVVTLELEHFPNYIESFDGDTTIACIGDTISIDASNANIISYMWSDGTNTDTNAIFSFIPTMFWQRAFVTVTDVHGCTRSGTHDFLEDAMTSATISADGNLDPFITYDAQDIPTNADSWYWSFGDGDTSHQANVQHEYSANGDYEYCFIAINQCGADSLCNTVSIQAVGIDQNEANAIMVYPNPVESAVVVTGLNGPFLIQVRSIGGALVFDQKSVANTEIIDMDRLAPGIYTLTLIGEGMRFTRKIALK